MGPSLAADMPPFRAWGALLLHSCLGAAIRPSAHAPAAPHHPLPTLASTAPFRALWNQDWVGKCLLRNASKYPAPDFASFGIEANTNYSRDGASPPFTWLTPDP